MPNLLYAELGATNLSRRQLVEQMAHHLGADVHFRTRHGGEGEYILQAVVSGGSITSPILVEAQGHDGEREALEASVLRRLLRDPVFKEATSFNAPQLHEALHPYEHLQTRAASAGGHTTLAIEERRLRGGRNTYTASLTLHLPGQEPLTRTEPGPNKDRAIHDAATALLEAKGWLPEIDLPKARAWVQSTADTAPSHGLLL